MLIIQPVEGTTPRGRQWRTQISLDTNDIREGETYEHAVIRQSRDNMLQLQYERSQLL